MTRSKRRFVKAVAAGLFAVALLAPTAASAAGRGGGLGGGQGNGGGGAPGGGGGGGEETVANNLSVPAIFIGANPFGLTCDGTNVDPTGTPLTGYSVPGSYYVQGLHTWRAACTTATTASVAAAWGDNLSGDAKLKVGSPIRVEMGLDAGQQNMAGYTVVKLEPDELDRVSPYGTNADGSGWLAAYPETRVWTAGAWLKIYPEGSPTAPIVNEAATAEINATGRVVYGYNLRVTAPGSYVIEFTAPNVTITGADAGTVVGNTVSLTIQVTGGGGGGRR